MAYVLQSSLSYYLCHLSNSQLIPTYLDIKQAMGQRGMYLSVSIIYVPGLLKLLTRKDAQALWDV